MIYCQPISDGAAAATAPVQNVLAVLASSVPVAVVMPSIHNGLFNPDVLTGFQLFFSLSFFYLFFFIRIFLATYGGSTIMRHAYVAAVDRPSQV